MYINAQTGLNMEGARMYTACCAVRDCMLQLGAGIDGGKDSLTMTAKVQLLCLSTLYSIFIPMVYVNIIMYGVVFRWARR